MTPCARDLHAREIAHTADFKSWFLIHLIQIVGYKLQTLHIWVEAGITR